MEPLMIQLPAMLTTLWWPFCRMLAMFSAAPMLGETMIPVQVRVLLSLALALVLAPAVRPVAAIDPMSLHALVATAQQVLIGFTIGLAFHLITAGIVMLGFTVSSKMGLSMAIINDPLNGQSSDVISALLNVLCILVFFGIDGHLVLVSVVGESFRAWPVGGGFSFPLLQQLAESVAWIFAAALLLALPVIFSSMVVQMGFGFLNRVAPALNLFSLGFSVLVIFGLFVLTWVVRAVPGQYMRMTRQMLEMLRAGMAG